MKLETVGVVAFGLFCTSAAPPSLADGEAKADEAIKAVKELCLVGTQYDLTADTKGNLTLTGGKATASVNVRKSSGAAAIFDNQVRRGADEDIRNCIKPNIPRIIDAILADTPRASNATLNPGKEVCETTKSELPSTGSAKYKVIDPFIWVDASHKLIYAHRKADGTLDAMMEYTSPMSAEIDYDSFATASLRLCLDRCSDEEACDAAEYFETSRSCHLLKGTLNPCVYPSKRPTYFASKLRRDKQ